MCLPCYQWFENPHNFKEHVKSRKHKRNVIHSQMGKEAKKSEMHNKTSSTSGYTYFLEEFVLLHITYMYVFLQVKV